MLKKALSLSLTLIMVLGMLSVTALAADVDGKYSVWAADTMQTAEGAGLIPDSLKGADFTKPVTRAEFAAISVKFFEALTGVKLTPAPDSTFSDTEDAEVLKAYNVGITAGVSADRFDPDAILSREQAATMMTRVLKAAYIPGWTLQTDDDYTLTYTPPAQFADDAKISDWAKPSVYFMAAKGIIVGTGNNNFSPYTEATREQALAIAVRIIDNLKDEPLDYTGLTPNENPALDALKTAITKAVSENMHDVEVTGAITVGKGERLDIPEDIHLDFNHTDASRAVIVVEKGGTLSIGDELIAGANGALVVESGFIAYTQYQFGTAIAIYGDVTLPAGKQFVCAGDTDKFVAIIIESGTFTVKGTLTMDTNQDDGCFLEIRDGKMTVAAGATLELLGGNASKDIVYEKGAKAIVDEDSTYSIKSGVDDEWGPWENIIGIEGIDTPNVVYTYDGSKWVK